MALLASPLFAQISVPEIPFDSAPNLLKMPDNIVMGEAVGVATNSKGHIFVYTRDGMLAYSVGSSRQFGRGAAARLYEFDEKGNFMREIGKGTYAQAFAHTVRVDPQDNIWMVDEGSNMIVKFSPEGKVLMTLGRKPEDFSGIPGQSRRANRPEGGRAVRSRRSCSFPRVREECARRCGGRRRRRRIRSGPVRHVQP